jgi:hypothetical protein
MAQTMARCKAFTKAGHQCRNNAISDTRFCYISSHGNVKKTLAQRYLNFVRNHWLSVALALIPFACATYWDVNQHRMSVTAGVLSAPTQESPMAVFVGSAEFVMLSKDGIVFDDGRIPLLAIHLIDGRLLVSIVIRDEARSLIAEMKDNEWKHQTQPAIFDRNYTRDVLEVRDGTGRVALQVANIGGAVEASAIFHCSNRWTYEVGSIAGEGSAIELRRPGQPLASEIPAICEYPSEKHLGSCPGLEGLQKRFSSRVSAIYPLQSPVHLCL